MQLSTSITAILALEVAYSLFSNLGIILAYAFILAKLCGQLKKTIQEYKDILNEDQISMLKRDLWCLGLLFLTIGQVYLFRLVHTYFLLTFDTSSQSNTTGVFAVRKTFLILGLFSALTARMRVSPIANGFSSGSLVEDQMLDKVSSISERPEGGETTE